MIAFSPSTIQAQTLGRGIGVVAGAPRVLLRVEGALVLTAAAVAYAHTGPGWLLFALLFFTPDIFMLGYLRGSRIGAALYNLGHSYIAPAVLYAAAISADAPVAEAVALIWIGHIGFDRAVGYGLKYPDRFKHTHLG